ncbi:sodium:solute symporter family protein [Oscillospiraceae bacterium 44-34]|nr:sodium:solute symporter family protein [Oscillibacter sp.]
MTIIIIFAIYMIAMMVVGQIGKKYSGTLSDSLTAGKQGTLIMVAGSFLGSHIGTGIVVGGATNGATYGVGAGWYGVGAALSFALFAFVTARWVRKHGYVTISTYFRDRYTRFGHIITLIVAIAGIFGATANIAAQVIAGKQLFVYAGIDPLIGSTIAVVVIGIYCTAAGLWGVMMTDVWQVIIIVIGMGAAIISLFLNFDGAAAISSLNADYFKAVPFDTETLLWMVVPTTMYGLISASAMQRAASAKTEKIALWGAIIGAVGTGLFTFLPVVIGMYGRAAFPEVESSSVLFTVMFQVLPEWLAALLLVAVVAAVMSTADTQLMTIMANGMHDIYTNTLAPKYNLNTDEKRMKTISTVLTVVVLIGALLLSFQFNNIQKLLSKALSITTSACVIPFLGGRFMKKGTDIGALASMGVALTLLVLNFTGVIHLVNDLVGLIPAAIVYVVVSLITYKDRSVIAE